MSAVTIARVKASLNESAGSPFELALQAVLILNIGDAVLTSWWVATGWATEANPLMNRVLELGIGPFLFTKAIIGMTAVIILKAHQTHLLSQRFGRLPVHILDFDARLNEDRVIKRADLQPGANNKLTREAISQVIFGHP